MNVLHTKYAFKRGPAVIHLQTTDDTIIFSDEDQEKIINIKSGIKVVSAINFSKVNCQGSGWRGTRKHG